MLSKITVSPAPHISRSLSTRRIMLDVIIGLTPAMIAAVVFFRQHAVVLILTCVLACLWAERLCNMIRKQRSSLGDLSAIVTGIILALSLPPVAPWWVAVMGGVFAIVIVKMLFGGLGGNIFNPAMAARTFLSACFGVLMTTWTVPATIDKTMPQIAAENTAVDAEIEAITQATPLAWSKEAVKATNNASNLVDSKIEAEQEIDRLTKLLEELELESTPDIETQMKISETKSAIADAKVIIAQSLDKHPEAVAKAEALSAKSNDQMREVFFGNVGGCLGETSALALLIGGLYLLVRRTITWHIPAAVLIAAVLFAGIFYLMNSENYPNPLFHLFSGGMLFCAFFIATDPVTAPLTNKGMLVFGAGVGLLIMLIRIIGEYPEGVMYAILIMNAIAPLIDRFFKMIPAGGIPNVK